MAAIGKLYFFLNPPNKTYLNKYSSAVAGIMVLNKHNEIVVIKYAIIPIL